MKTKLVSLAIAMLATTILAHAVTVPTAPSGFCSNASDAAKTVINILLLVFTGQGLNC